MLDSPRLVMSGIVSVCLAATGLVFVPLSAGETAKLSNGSGDSNLAPESQGRKSDGKAYETENVRGRVVYLSEALQRRFGVKTVPEANQRVLALETTDEQLLPLVEDGRGRSFRKDSRLRNMDVELYVRRYRGAPLLQVMRIYELKDDKKFLVDYWCDTCAIVMFEDGPCDCCQDHNRIRKREVSISTPAP